MEKLSNLQKDLHALAGDAAAGNVMVGIGENYLPAFVLALTASHATSGLVQSVPLLVGAVLQLAAPGLLRRFGSYRRWVVVCVAVQAAAFMPLAAAAVFPGFPVLLIFLLAALYWGSGMATGPAWNAWVGTLVPERIRARYFARRSLICQVGFLAGFLLGGFALQARVLGDSRLQTFALLFLIAAAARFISVGFLSRHSEPLPPVEEPCSWRWHSMLQTLNEGGKGRTLLYLLGAQAAVQISGPYFTPYMLGHLEFSYARYAILVSIAYVARIACLPVLGRLADRWGAQRLLWLGGTAIVPVAGLWLVSDSFYYLIFVQIISGAAWATYELAMFLLFFEHVPRQRRVAVLTVFNLFNAMAIVTGSVVGGCLLVVLGENRGAYFTLFLASTTVRAAALLLLAKLPSRTTSLARLRPLLLRLSFAIGHRPLRMAAGASPPMPLRQDALVRLPALDFDPAGKKATAA